MKTSTPRRVYFDHSATSPMLPEVKEAMLPYLVQDFGNASSIHSFGRGARAAVESARKSVAALINADPHEIVFTSGGTESDNLAVKGVAWASGRTGGHIVTSVIEHHAVLEPCAYLKRFGFEVTEVPVDSDGIVDPGQVEGAIRDDTVLVSVMTANNEIGTIQPVGEIGKIARAHGIPFHTDAVQAAGKMSIDVRRDSVDLLSLSGHKFHGPKGVGVLYVRKGLELDPLLHGGGHERGLRSSTENVPGIVGIGKAAEIAGRDLEIVSKTMAVLRDEIIEGVLGEVPNSYLNGHRTRRLCNSANLRFDYIEGEALVLQLDLAGIATSTGSACSTGSLEPSHVLLALGIPSERARGSLRVSLGRENTEEDGEYFLEVLPGIVSRLREISPLGRQGPAAAGGCEDCVQR
jgi:cysteine desulfurase